MATEYEALYPTEAAANAGLASCPKIYGERFRLGYVMPTDDGQFKLTAYIRDAVPVRLDDYVWPDGKAGRPVLANEFMGA